jgi:hypothetical protein
VRTWQLVLDLITHLQIQIKDCFLAIIAMQSFQKKVIFKLMFRVFIQISWRVTLTNLKLMQPFSGVCMHATIVMQSLSEQVGHLSILVPPGFSLRGRILEA